MEQQESLQLLVSCKLLAQRGLQNPKNVNLSRPDWKIIGRFSDLFDTLDGNLTAASLKAGLTGPEIRWLIETMVRYRYGLLEK